MAMVYIPFVIVVIFIIILIANDFRIFSPLLYEYTDDNDYDDVVDAKPKTL